MIAEIAGQTLLVDLAQLAASLLTLGALLAGATRLRPVRWLWRHLVTEPLSEWFGSVIEARIADIKAQFVTNGGTTAKDQLDRLEEAQLVLADGIHEIRQERRAEADERAARQEALDQRLAALEDGLAVFRPVLDDWRRSHPESRPDLDDDGGQT